MNIPACIAKTVPRQLKTEVWPDAFVFNVDAGYSQALLCATSVLAGCFHQIQKTGLRRDIEYLVKLVDMDYLVAETCDGGMTGAEGPSVYRRIGWGAYVVGASSFASEILGGHISNAYPLSIPWSVHWQRVFRVNRRIESFRRHASAFTYSREWSR